MVSSYLDLFIFLQLCAIYLTLLNVYFNVLGEFDSIDVAIDGANERTTQVDEDKNHPNIIILDEQE